MKTILADIKNIICEFFTCIYDLFSFNLIDIDFRFDEEEDWDW